MEGISTSTYRVVLVLSPLLVLAVYFAAIAQEAGSPQKSKLPDQTYMPVAVDADFESIYQADAAQKSAVIQRQQQLLEQRYDLRDHPSDVMMSGGRRAVQKGPLVAFMRCL